MVSVIPITPGSRTRCGWGSPTRPLQATWGAPEPCSAARAEAIAYAKWLVSREHQRNTYFREGGQPASLAAWTDSEVDREACEFFSGTLKTLQSAYVRPRFDGFVRFFEAAGIEINRCLRGEIDDKKLVQWLNTNYAQRLAAAAGS